MHRNMNEVLLSIYYVVQAGLSFGNPPVSAFQKLKSQVWTISLAFLLLNRTYWSGFICLLVWLAGLVWFCVFSLHSRGQS